MPSEAVNRTGVQPGAARFSDWPPPLPPHAVAATTSARATEAGVPRRHVESQPVRGVLSLFVAYLLIIGVGIVLYTLVGATHH